MSGIPMLKTVHWSLCKIAHLRPDAKDGQRPTRGRPPKPAAEELPTPDMHTPSTDRLMTADRHLTENQPTANQSAEDRSEFVDIQNPANIGTAEPEITQPLTTNDENSPSGRSPSVLRPSPPSGMVTTTTPAMPEPSPALADSPHPFPRPQSPEPESEYSGPDSDEDDDDDQPFHGFKPAASHGRPKRNTRKPVRYPDFETYAVREL